MTREDIQLALRLVAHGRVNHPQVEELAEKLAAVLAPRGIPTEIPDGSVSPTSTPLAESVAKRRKKAE